MTIQTSTIRPGLLVGFKTSVEGGAKYSKTDLELDHVTEDGERRARWETERVIADPGEYRAACVARNKARTLIRGVCTLSAFGMLCPEDKRPQLDAAADEAQQVIDKFNKKAKLSKVYLYVIAAKIAQNDVEATRAIRSEVRAMLTDMEQGLKNLDVRVVRDAARRAKGMASMLSDDAAERVKGAIEAARGAAKKIVKAGEQAAVEIDRQAIAKITESRTAFLDLDEAAPIKKTKTKARAVDLIPEGETRPKTKRKTSAAALELE